jgi:hypothetical protein
VSNHVSPPFTDVPVSIQESEWWCICELAKCYRFSLCFLRFFLWDFERFRRCCIICSSFNSIETSTDILFFLLMSSKCTKTIWFQVMARLSSCNIKLYIYYRHWNSWICMSACWNLTNMNLNFGVKRHFQQYFNYIMATSFSGGGSRSTRRELSTLGKQLVNFITCGCESSAPFL